MSGTEQKPDAAELARQTKQEMAAALRGYGNDDDPEEAYRRQRDEEDEDEARRRDDESVDSQKSFSKISMADFFRQLQGSGGGDKKKKRGTEAPQEKTRYVARSGLTIRQGPALTANELVTSRVVVKKEDRGDSARDIQRTRERVIKALELKLSTPKYEEVLDATKELDLADYSNNWQQAIEGFYEWAHRFDVIDIFQVPDNFDPADPTSIVTCNVWTNLIRKFDEIPLDDVKEWQVFLNCWSGPLERQSSDWAVDVLKISTEKNLLSQVNQDYTRLPSEQRGACTYYKLIVSRIVIRTHEAKIALQNYITNFDIRNFDGENVSMAVMRIKAVLTSLTEKDVPSNALTKITKGFSSASQEDFKNLCITQSAQFATPLYKMAFEKYSITQQIYITLETFEARYQEILTANDWSGVGKEASAFKLELADNTYKKPADRDDSRKKFVKKDFNGYNRDSGNRRDQKQRYATKEEWLANQVCRGCKEKGHFWRDCPAEAKKRRAAERKLGIKDKKERKVFLSVIEDLVSLRVNKALAENEEIDDYSFSSSDASASEDEDSDAENEDEFRANAARAFSSLKE